MIHGLRPLVDVDEDYKNELVSHDHEDMSFIKSLDPLELEAFTTSVGKFYDVSHAGSATRFGILFFCWDHVPTPAIVPPSFTRSSLREFGSR